MLPAAREVVARVNQAAVGLGFGMGNTLLLICNSVSVLWGATIAPYVLGGIIIALASVVFFVMLTAGRRGRLWAGLALNRRSSDSISWPLKPEVRPPIPRNTSD